jgi:hypothetical protein
MKSAARLPSIIAYVLFGLVMMACIYLVGRLPRDAVRAYLDRQDVAVMATDLGSSLADVDYHRGKLRLLVSDSGLGAADVDLGKQAALEIATFAWAPPVSEPSREIAAQFIEAFLSAYNGRMINNAAGNPGHR